MAITAGSTDVCEFFLGEEIIDPNDYNKEPFLMLAARTKNHQLVKMFLEHDAAPNTVDKIVAAENEYISLVKLLLCLQPHTTVIPASFSSCSPWIPTSSTSPSENIPFCCAPASPVI